MVNRQRQAAQTGAKAPIRLNWSDDAVISLTRRSPLQVILRLAQFRRLRVALPPLLRELSVSPSRALRISALSGSTRGAQQRTRAILAPAERGRKLVGGLFPAFRAQENLAEQFVRGLNYSGRSHRRRHRFFSRGGSAHDFDRLV